MHFFRRAAKPSAPSINTNFKKEREYYYLGDGFAQVRLKNGYFIYVDPLEESVCSHLIAHGEWEPWISDVVLRLVRPGDHVVEVGGHVGYYTLGLAAKVGETGSVLTFEANARLANLAQRSIRFNGFGSHVRIENKVASHHKGSVKFLLSRQFAGGSHLYLRDGLLAKDAEVVEVESVRLDDLQLPQLRLLRIDAEGSEVLILQGATRLLEAPKLIICMEWDLVQMKSRSDPSVLVGDLVKQGYMFWQIKTDSTIEPVEPAAMMTLPACDVIISREDVPGILASAA